jgi:hypothetical protein
MKMAAQRASKSRRKQVDYQFQFPVISYQLLAFGRLGATAVKFLLAETFDNSKELPLG